jgi:photosystem II stability/assembly factor-like uncharacterized protein
MRRALAAAVAAGALAVSVPAATHAEPRCAGELVSGTFGFATCGQHVFVTRDSRTWRDVTPPRLRSSVIDVVFINARTGWVVTNDCTAGRASVHRTSDGGRTWARTPVKPTNCAAGSRLELSFLDSKHGWLVRIYENGNQTGLDRTVDGGRVWAHGGVPVKGSVVFRTTRQGFAARPDFRGWGLLLTSDGGRTWRRHALAAPPGWTGAAVAPDRPSFFGRDGVLPADLVLGKRRAVAFYLTHDGGRTWQAGPVRRVGLPITRDSNPFVFYAPVSVPRASTWWLAPTGRTIAVTTDGGRHWRLERRPKGTTLTAADGRHAWLSGDGLFRTSDGGGSWHRLTPG